MSKPTTTNTNTTSAKKPGQAPKPRDSKPATTAPAQSSATNGAAEKLTYQERMRKMKPHERVRTKLDSTIERFEYIVSEVETWRNKDPKKPEAIHPDVLSIVKGAKAALAAIEEVTDLVKALPKDFVADKPRKAPTSSLEEGAIVNLREKHGKTYDDVIETKDRKGMTVMSVRKGRVVVKTVSGEKIVLPRGHVEPAPEKKDKGKVA